MKTLAPEEIERIRNGDNTPLGKVYVENKTFCIINLHNRKRYSLPDIEDAYADAILVLRDKILEGVFENKNIASFLLQVTHNKLRNKYKRDRRFTVFDLKAVEQYFLMKKSGEDDTLILSPEDERKVNAVLMALKSLNKPCHQLLTLYWLENIPLKEIQQTLGYSTYNSIKSAKSRCQRTLAQKAKEILGK